ncbi:hypothetical protein [Mucilaginibacter aquaedulcis]|uniref:hypothetical protein n=1 Tax=Mucilaginibacter aquaedulcis TaxID=1187081 RepID=UPI0025B5A9DC|nr:hypothetical protein [Mucilaginibacter aquaedulcis]MDN3548951.1 hypothetical protein [Mucilaginibacter aquaedulcis]
MNGPFTITVLYQGVDHEFKARFERMGYTHRISVLIGESTFIFEPDEEGGYRVLNQPGAENKSADSGLLGIVVEKLVGLNS